MKTVANNNKPHRLNPEGIDLTPEKLVTFPKLANLPKEQAIRITEQIKDFARYCYDLIQHTLNYEASTED